jgi:chromosome segregation ATPase
MDPEERLRFLKDQIKRLKDRKKENKKSKKFLQPWEKAEVDEAIRKIDEKIAEINAEITELKLKNKGKEFYGGLRVTPPELANLFNILHNNYRVQVNNYRNLINQLPQLLNQHGVQNALNIANTIRTNLQALNVNINNLINQLQNLEFTYNEPLWINRINNAINIAQGILNEIIFQPLPQVENFISNHQQGQGFHRYNSWIEFIKANRGRFSTLSELSREYHRKR